MIVFQIFAGLLCLSFLVYIAVLFYLGRGFDSLQNQKRVTEETPFITVVVCSHNEEKNLQDCISHLSVQNYPQEQLEFIMVNDRSNDGTASILRSAASSDKRFRILTISQRQSDMAPKKFAIDSAIKQARGSIILLTDADGRPGKNWVKTMASYFCKDTDMVIGYAPYAVKPVRHFAKRILAFEYLSHAAVASATTGIGYPATCVGTNMAYRKKLYEDIGGFGEFKQFISGDDDLFLTRVRSAGKYTIKYACDFESHVYNNPPSLWRKFIHQRMRYASKGFDYPLKLTLALLSYYFFNLFIFCGLLAGVFNLQVLTFFSGLFFLKGLFEFRFMQKAGKTLSDSRYLPLFPIAYIMHLPYVVVFGILGQFKHFQWAEDQAESAVQREILKETI